MQKFFPEEKLVRKGFDQDVVLKHRFLGINLGKTHSIEWRHVGVFTRFQTSVKPSFEMRALALGNVV